MTRGARSWGKVVVEGEVQVHFAPCEVSQKERSHFSKQVEGAVGVPKGENVS